MSAAGLILANLTYVVTSVLVPRVFGGLMPVLRCIPPPTVPEYVEEEQDITNTKSLKKNRPELIKNYYFNVKGFIGKTRQW